MPPELLSRWANCGSVHSKKKLLCGLQSCPYTVVCIIAGVALIFTCEMQMPMAIVLPLPGFLLLVRYASLKQFHIAFSKAASLLRTTPSIPLFIKVSCQIFYFDNICILYVMLLDAGSVTRGWKNQKGVCILYTQAL